MLKREEKIAVRAYLKANGITYGKLSEILNISKVYISYCLTLKNSFDMPIYEKIITDWINKQTKEE